MKVNYVTRAIEKPPCVDTPGAVIPFDSLSEYLSLFRAVVVTETAAKAMDAWATAGYPQEKLGEVLRGVIVSFGGG